MEERCWEMRFDREALGQKLLVEILPSLLTHQNTSTSFVFSWSTSAPHHLENVHDRVVYISMLFALVVLDTHDDDHVTRDRQTPCSILQQSHQLPPQHVKTGSKYLGRYKDLDGSGLEKSLNNSLVLFIKRLVVKADTMFESFDETAIHNVIQMRL